MAVVSMTDPYVRIPDTVSYNLYYGWYGGDTNMNGAWLDKLHKSFPELPIGISEYGADALNWHTSKPMQGDYAEEYQAYYHEDLMQMISGFTVKRVLGMMGSADRGKALTKEQMLELNAKLNRIKK